jgi:WD40 repeat protein
MKDKRKWVIKIWLILLSVLCATAAIAGENSIMSAAFSADGKKIQAVNADGLYRVWELDTGKIIKSINLPYTSQLSFAKISTNGKFILMSSFKEYECKIVDAETGKLITLFKKIISNVTMPYAAVVSSDDKSILLGDYYKLFLWDIETKKIIKIFAGHNGTIYSVALSNDGKYAASGSEGSLKIWDVENEKEYSNLKILFPIDNNGTVQWGTYEEMMKKEKRAAQSGMLPIWAVAFSFDGNLLVSGGFDSIIRLWDVKTGYLLFTNTGIPIISAAFSPDNKRLVTGGLDKSLILWDVMEGLTKIKELISPNIAIDWSGAISTVSFSKDGKYILSGSDDGLRLWDVNTGKEIRNYK